MPPTTFWVNTALVCYKCRRTGIIRLMQSWRDVYCIGQELEVLEIVFVTCVLCKNLFNSLIPLYIDPLKYYPNPIQDLEQIFGCTRSILQRNTFVLNRMKKKTVAKLYDESEVFYMPAVPEANVMVIQKGFEIQNFCRFFSHDPYSTTRIFNRYPRKGENTSSLPFATVAKRPPVHLFDADTVLRSSQVARRLCSHCLSELRCDEHPVVDLPPAYTSRDTYGA